MNDLSINFEDEKNRLTEKLSEQYARNAINIEEYERLLDYINKIETKKELTVVNNIIQGYNTSSAEEAPARQKYNSYEVDDAPGGRIASFLFSHGGREHAAVFSTQTTTLEPVNGKGGKFTSVFGTHRIMADYLPPGRTVINLEIVFGTCEIIVSRNTRIINKADTVFSGISAPNESYNYHDNGSMPELVIKGEVVFGNLTIIRK